MHGVAAYPIALAEALAKRHKQLRNVEINHLHIEYDRNPFSDPEIKRESFLVNNYFVGKEQRKNVNEGRSDMIPCFLSDLPGLMRDGYRRPDVAIVQVSPPDRHGFCSLGVEVCTAYAACETARLVIAQINKNVPRTHGQGFVHFNSFDYVVELDKELPSTEAGPLGEGSNR
jgi:4-hydroxybutyrate CoA-transferase